MSTFVEYFPPWLLLAAVAPLIGFLLLAELGPRFHPRCTRTVALLVAWFAAGAVAGVITYRSGAPTPGAAWLAGLVAIVALAPALLPAVGVHARLAKASPLTRSLTTALVGSLLAPLAIIVLIALSCLTGDGGCI